MDQKELDFLAKLLASYRIESEEHLKNLTDGLLALENRPSGDQEKELVESVFRAAHSLKSASRAVDFLSVEKLCQAMENVLSEWKQQNLFPDPVLFDVFFAGIDWIRQTLQLSGPLEVPSDSHLLEQLLLQLEELPYSSSLKTSAEQVSNPSSIQTLEEQLPAGPPPADSSTPIPPPKELEQVIRVSSQKLSNLLQQAEEAIAIKFMADQQLQDLYALHAYLQNWTMQRNFSDASHPTNDRLSQIVKEMDVHLQISVRKASQNSRLINRLIDQLVAEAKKVLMQPFASLFNLFPKMARDIGRSLSKDIRLQFFGGDIEIDRRILEELRDPLTHLLRNSIDHGIELPDERLPKQKPPFGTVIICASHLNEQRIELLIEDDGRGIETEKIKKAALKQNITTEQEWSKLTEKEKLSLIFQSGLSTSAAVSTLSGRGLGMGIVAEKIEKLGGSIQVETKKGQGTTFRLILPVSLATFRGVHIRSVERDFIISTQHVKKVIKLSPDSIQILKNKETLPFEEQQLPYISLSSLIQPSHSHQSSSAFALILHAANKAVAIGVDDVLNEQEVLLKKLGTQIIHAQNIASATITESGQVIPVLDVFDLVKSIIKNTES